MIPTSDQTPVNETTEEVRPVATPLSRPGLHESSLSTKAIRLLAGTVLESSDLILNWLEGDRSDVVKMSDTDVHASSEIHNLVKYSAIGFGFRSVEVLKRNLGLIGKITSQLGEIVLMPAIAILSTRPFVPLREEFDRLVEKGKTEVADWAQIGAEEERNSRAQARETSFLAVEDIIRYLSESPALDALIQFQIDQLAIESSGTTQVDVLVRVLADNYIHYLMENPERVQGLIQAQGDTYLEHLEENPDQIQSLVQGQGGGLIDDMTDEVRELAVTGDSLLELLARKIIRKPPRRELPGPAPQVRIRATHPRTVYPLVSRESEDDEPSESARTV